MGLWAWELRHHGYGGPFAFRRRRWGGPADWRARALDLGDDGPRLRRTRLRGLPRPPHGGVDRLIEYANETLESRLRAAFFFRRPAKSDDPTQRRHRDRPLSSDRLRPSTARSREGLERAPVSRPGPRADLTWSLPHDRSSRRDARRMARRAPEPAGRREGLHPAARSAQRQAPGDAVAQNGQGLSLRRAGGAKSHARRPLRRATPAHRLSLHVRRPTGRSPARAARSGPTASMASPSISPSATRASSRFRARRS